MSSSFILAIFIGPDEQARALTYREHISVRRREPAVDLALGRER
jgi:hypothetical protein